MKARRLAARIALGVAALLIAIGAGWIASLPPGPADEARAAPLSAREVDATLAALAPPKRQRPLVAIVGINDATETTDYIMPYGILRRADVADVIALSTEPGLVKLYPALQVEPQATIAEFDARHAEGADYVVVPAMSRDDDPAVLAWLRNQASKGAIIVGVCAGAKVVAAAGLLDGKRATTHWYFVDELRDEHPTLRYVPDRRVIVDQGVATTTGITASMPASLTLIEAIAGRDAAQGVARDLGLPHWDVAHESGDFELTRPFALTVLGNILAFWRREQLGIELQSGVDEVALALVADAWSRTYRSRATTFAPTRAAQASANGLRVLPDQVAASWPRERLLPPIGERAPATALEETLGAIEARYGTRTAKVVAMQLEYPRQAAAPSDAPGPLSRAGR